MEACPTCTKVKVTLQLIKVNIWELNRSIQHRTDGRKQTLTVLCPLPFKWKPLSKSEEDPRLWSVDGPGEPERDDRRSHCQTFSSHSGLVYSSFIPSPPCALTYLFVLNSRVNVDSVLPLSERRQQTGGLMGCLLGSRLIWTHSVKCGKQLRACHWLLKRQLREETDEPSTPRQT